MGHVQITLHPIGVSLLLGLISFCFWPTCTMRWMRDVLDFTKDYGGPAAGTIVAVYAGYRLLKRRSRKNAIAARGQAASQAREEAESRLKQSVTADSLMAGSDRKIVDLPVEQLAEELKAGNLTSVQVLRSYMLKALEVSHDLNCVTEPISLDGCEAMANLLDSKVAEVDRSELGMLHGLPVSIKENINVAGMYTTMGLLQHARTPATQDAVIVRVLRAHGAIPYTKTNLPQTMVSFDCSNPLYGVTRNPHNPDRTPGGSSGGEGALLGSGGSVLGIGTDIGGSVRLPAAFCGVCGFKPTMGRISHIGVESVMAGQTGLAISAGVMARSVSGCELLMKALCSKEAFDLDASVVPVTLNENALKPGRKLRIGYFKTAEFFHATPANQRAVSEAVDALRSAGHELVEFAAPDMYSIMAQYYDLILADGMGTVMDALDGDEYDPSIAYGAKLYGIPSVIRRTLASALYYTWRRMSSLLFSVQGKSVQELWQLQKKRSADAKSFSNDLRGHGLDGLICPAQATGPLPIGTCAKLTASVCYTALANIYNLPSGVVPVTRVTQEDDDAMSSYPHNDLWGYLTRKLCKGMVGLPIAVQCITPTWRDEDCLYMMKELEASLKH
ncbi:vitamin D3 hydroxylase-associated protein-like [Sycon ciliatum]|uniref:vitamin D3 hydroxylase-associated protein-like n=1 Tax=Sycon ciliatum TaxID=27933 RepID=UPI0031F66736